jgi:hypothetical protein
MYLHLIATTVFLQIQSQKTQGGLVVTKTSKYMKKKIMFLTQIFALKIAALLTFKVHFLSFVDASEMC